MIDYYNILGVSRQADAKEIKVAFKKLALLYHPDRNRTDIQAEEKFKQINEAYQVLSDTQKRLVHDLQLNGQSTYTTYKPNASYQPSSSQTNTSQRRSRPYYRPKTYNAEETRKSYFIGVAIMLAIVVVSLIIYTYGNRNAARSYYAEAMVYAEQNQLYPALMKLTEALTLDDEFAEAYQKRGELKLVGGYDYKDAFIDFNNAITYAQPPTPEMYFYRGLSLYKMGKYPKAKEDFKKAYQQTELQGVAIFMQAASRKAMGDYIGACQDWQKAYELGMPAAMDSLQTVCQQDGD